MNLLPVYFESDIGHVGVAFMPEELANLDWDKASEQEKNKWQNYLSDIHRIYVYIHDTPGVDLYNYYANKFHDEDKSIEDIVESNDWIPGTFAKEYEESEYFDGEQCNYMPFKNWLKIKMTKNYGRRRTHVRSHTRAI